MSNHIITEYTAQYKSNSKLVKLILKSRWFTVLYKPLNFFANIYICFIKQSHISFKIYKNYYGQNNLILKNSYPILIICDSLNWQKKTKHII